jgi:hypothetical protein
LGQLLESFKIIVKIISYFSRQKDICYVCSRITTHRKPIAMPIRYSVKRSILVASLALPAVACMAAEPILPMQPAINDLSAKLIQHSASCLAPKLEPCAIHRPVGTGYRILTPEVGLEDVGEYWIVDFSKTKAAKNKDATFSFRVMEANGIVHEIRVEFSEAAAAAAKSKVPARNPAKAKVKAD